MGSAAKIVNFLEVGANFNLAPTEAVAFFVEKGLAPSFAWQDMLGAEHDAAFTVAKMMDTDLLVTVKRKLEKALAEGSTLADFKKDLIPTLQAAGWWGKKDLVDPLTGAVVKAQLGSASRLETIFRSNLQSAYAVGQWDSIVRNARVLPFLMYDAVDDGRTRPEHADRDGEVHPVHSDFWKSHYPPNGWNCRCGVIQLDQDDLDAMGLTPIKAPTIKTRKWTNPRTGTVLDVPVDVDPGWDHNPGIARQAKLAAEAEAKASKLLAAEQRALKKAQGKQAAAQAAYEKQLKQDPTLAALAKKTEEAQLAIQKALDDGTPYLSNEIKKLQDKKPGIDPVALLAQATEKATKAEQNSMVQTWKQAMLKGKEPSAKAQAYVNSLPEEQLLALKADIDGKTGATAAKAELAAISAGQAESQAKLKQKILAKFSKDGTAAQYASDPKGLLAAVVKEAADQQTKAEKASVLSGYKKKAIEGKIPTPKQQQVFNSLTDAEKAKVMADIDAKKPKPTPKPEDDEILAMFLNPDTDTAKPKSVATAAPKAIEDLTPEQQYTVLYNLTDGGEMAIPPPSFYAKMEPDVIEDFLTSMSDELDYIANHEGTTPEDLVAAFLAKNPVGKTAAKAAQKAAPVPPPKSQAKPAPKPSEPAAKAYSDLSDEHKYETAYYVTGAEEAGFPAPEIFKGLKATEKKAYVRELEALADEFADGEEFPDGNAMLQSFVDQSAKDGVPWALKAKATPAPAVAASKAAPAPTAPIATGAPDPDKLVQVGGQGGSNKGGTFQDPETGQKWYLKQPKSPEIARNEVLAGKFYEAAGIEVPELHLVEWQGQTSIASKIIDGLEENRALLTSGKDVPGVSDGFMMDAWLANWDVVGLDYDNLLVKGGRAIRVDTGGALRFRAQGTAKGDAFGKMVMELESLRDGTASQTTSVFKNLTREQMIASARRVVAFTDGQIDDLVAQYGPTRKAERTKLATILKARRDHIAREFPEAVQVPKPEKVPDGKRITRLEQENIANSRSNGYSIATDKDHIEDQNVLLWHKTAADGTGTTSGYLKVRGAAEEALRKQLAANSGPADYNDLHDKVIAAVISVRSRAIKGDAFTQGAWEKVSAAVARFDAVVDGMLEEIKDGRRDPQTLADFEAKTLPFINQLRDAAALGPSGKPRWTDVGMYKTWSIPTARPKDGGGTSWKRRRTEYNLAELERGHAREQKDLFSVRSDVYETEIDGVRVRYWPDQDGVLFALRGRVEIQVPGKTEASAARVFQVLEELGVDSSRATPADIEALYLRQIAYANKVDQQQGFSKLMDSGDHQGAKAWLSKKLGVDLDKSPHYRPEGERQAFEHGRRTRYRPELLSHPEWAEFERDYRLHHSITNGDTVESIKRVLNGGGQMAPTTDKIRRGIPLGGMSPEQDLETGGANYFFTRIKETGDATRRPGLVWRARVAARVDAISYNGDKYGRTTGDHVRRNRRHTIDGMRKAAEVNNNETIIKDSLSLFDDLDVIVAASQEERAAIIKVFRQAGYQEWPDGRSLTDVIRLRS